MRQGEGRTDSIRKVHRTPGLIALGILIGMTSRSLIAQEGTGQSAGPIEEVIVVGESASSPTEMDQDTAQLLSIAGAAFDPLQAIYALPGVTFTTNDGPGGAEPAIRGSAPQDNAYFIDLIPVSYIFHLFGNSIFDKQVINSFDLYPGAFPSKYGNATGGVIDVTLREPRNQPFTTTLHTSLLSSGLMVESRLGDNQSIYATYRRSMVDLFADEEDIDTDDEGFQIDDLPIFDDYQLKYSWDINPNNQLSVVAAGASDTLAATFNENHEEAAKDPDFAGPASLEQGFDSQGVIWNWRNGSRALTGIVSHIGRNDDFVYGRGQHEKTESNRNMVRLLYEQSLNADHVISAGLSLGDVRYDMDFNAKIVACNELDPECSTVDAEYIVYRDTLDVAAHEAFIEDQWSIGNRQALTFGFNFSDDDYLADGRIEPRIKWEYSINDTLSTHFSAGQYSQLPQLREMIDVLGNPNLRTEKSDHYVWGVSQRLGNGWRWNADIYYKDMTGVVISSEQDSSAENYSNGAEGNAYGIEFLVNRDVSERWYGWASLSLARTDRRNTVTGETVRFEYDKPVLFNLVGNRIISDKWTVGFRWSYQSGGRYTPVVDLIPSSSNPDVLEPVYGSLNSQRYPDYHRLDFRAERTNVRDWGYWKFYIDAFNVYNHKNVERYDYAPNGKDLIAPPAGFAPNVPVKKEIGDSFFPSIGFEVQF